MKRSWQVASTSLYDEEGRLLGIANHDGKWQAQEFEGGIEFVKRGHARSHTLRAAQKACEGFLKSNASERQKFFETRTLKWRGVRRR